MLATEKRKLLEDKQNKLKDLKEQVARKDRENKQKIEKLKESILIAKRESKELAESLEKNKSEVSSLIMQKEILIEKLKDNQRLEHKLRAEEAILNETKAISQQKRQGRGRPKERKK